MLHETSGYHGDNETTFESASAALDVMDILKQLPANDLAVLAPELVSGIVSEFNSSEHSDYHITELMTALYSAYTRLESRAVDS